MNHHYVSRLLGPISRKTNNLQIAPYHVTIAAKRSRASIATALALPPAVCVPVCVCALVSSFLFLFWLSIFPEAKTCARKKKNIITAGTALGLPPITERHGDISIAQRGTAAQNNLASVRARARAAGFGLGRRMQLTLPAASNDDARASSRQAGAAAAAPMDGFRLWRLVLRAGEGVMPSRSPLVLSQNDVIVHAGSHRRARSCGTRGKACCPKGKGGGASGTGCR